MLIFLMDLNSTSSYDAETGILTLNLVNSGETAATAELQRFRFEFLHRQKKAAVNL